MRYLITLMLVVTLLTGCRRAEIIRMPLSAETYSAGRDISRVILTHADHWKDKRVFLHHSYASVDDNTGRFYVWVDYHSQLLLDVDGARWVMVDLTQELLKDLNDYPFDFPPNDGDPITHFDLYVSIEFESYHGKYVDPLYVGRTELKEGYLTCYYAHTALDRHSVVFHQHFEPYESSVHFVRIEKELQELRDSEKEARSGLRNTGFIEIDNPEHANQKPYDKKAGWVE